MSSKIYLKDIVIGHFKSLADAGKNKVSIIDIFTFYVIPFAISGISFYFCFDVSKETISLLVNFGAIFTALLLSVLVLVYDQENKLNDQSSSGLVNAKKKLLNQLYYNICYCIVSSVTLIIVCLIHSVVENTSPPLNVYFVTPLIIFVTTNLILTILMVVKRMHVLLVS